MVAMRAFVLTGLALALGAACVDDTLPPRPVTAVELPDAAVDGEPRDASSRPPDAAIDVDTGATPDLRPGADVGPSPPPKDANGPVDTAPPKDASVLADAAAAPDRGPSTGTGRVALVVGNAAVPIPADTLAQARLEARGLTVAVIDETVAAPADAVGRDLIVISSSISTRAMAFERIAQYRGSAAPILCLAVHTCDQLGMTVYLGAQSGQSPDNEDSITITGEGHPLAAGLPNGNVPIMIPRSGAKWILYWMNPHDTAIRVAIMRDNPAQVAIFGFEKGFRLSNQQLAPARRVGFTLMPTSYNGSYELNATGIKLLDAAIDWALN
jgi:hypothetical protein